MGSRATRPPCDDPWPRPSWPARRVWRAVRRGAFALLSASMPRPSPPPLAWRALRRIVVLRDDRLGDALLATPLVVALREACPSAEIVVVASAANREVFARLGECVDRVVISSGRWSELLALARALRASGPIDLVLDLYSWAELRPAVLAWLTRAPVRAGFDLDRRGFLHTHRFPAPTGLRYEVERNLDLARALGLRYPAGTRPRFAVGEPDRVEARDARRAAALDDPAASGRDYVVLHPGSGARYSGYRRVSPAVLGEVARRLVAESSLDVYVTGGPDEIALADQVIATAASGAVRSLAGGLSLGALAALLEGARFVVVPDTGVLHLAVAVGAETVALVGPVGVVNGPARVLPCGARMHPARLDLGCRPPACHIERCRSVACLRDLDAETILSACRGARVGRFERASGGLSS